MSTRLPEEHETTDGSEYLKVLGAVVRRERKSRGYSQEGFADVVGMDRSYMGGVERGERNISFINLMRILETLRAEPAAFFAQVPLRAKSSKRREKG